jgi:uncharacterized protein (DUF934 family)
MKTMGKNETVGAQVLIAIVFFMCREGFSSFYKGAGSSLMRSHKRL